MKSYPEVFSRLTFETAFIIFVKKDGTVRVMLGTRNMSTISIKYGFQGKALGGHDNRCNINNGNVAVFDLLLGDARSFNIDRLVEIEYHGVIEKEEDLDRVALEFLEFKKNYEETKPMEVDMSMLD